jgi:hypothetical protein
MMRSIRVRLFTISLRFTLAAYASVVSSVRGVIHDPQHRPVQDAMVMIKAENSDWAATVNSDAAGNFGFNAVPLGEYTVTVAGVGFEQSQQDVVVVSGSSPVLHFALNVAGAKETINVSGNAVEVPTDTIVDRFILPIRTRSPKALCRSPGG